MCTYVHTCLCMCVCTPAQGTKELSFEGFPLLKADVSATSFLATQPLLAALQQFYGELDMRELKVTIHVHVCVRACVCMCINVYTNPYTITFSAEGFARAVL